MYVMEAQETVNHDILTKTRTFFGTKEIPYRLDVSELYLDLT